MADPNGRAILALLKRAGNNTCADCGRSNTLLKCKYFNLVKDMFFPDKYADPYWASYNIGIFICSRCADIHRGMGAHTSKVKHIKLDRWEDSQLQRMKEVGNTAAKLKYESRVPLCYRRPVEGDPQSLLEDWICAKYLREEFSRPERPSFMSGCLEGFLMKRGKEDARYHPRKFILMDDTLKYYVKEKKDPKAILKLCDLNVVFAPEKTQNPNSLQLTYLKDSITRHIYVYHDDPQTIVNWYMAIRCAKLHKLQVMYPEASEEELVDQLTQDFAREGWLWKTGPKPTDAYKKRWFTLDCRKLMYHEEPLDAHPKGEIFVGHMLEGYSVRVGVPPGAKDQGYTFTLRTPERWFYLSATTSSDRDLWIQAIEFVLEKPLTLQDKAIAAKLVRKKGGSSLNIFSTR